MKLDRILGVAQSFERCLRTTESDLRPRTILEAMNVTETRSYLQRSDKSLYRSGAGKVSSSRLQARQPS